MGRYVDWADVVLRYPTINNIGGASEIGSAYIGYSENFIDGYLATHFTVPFSSNNETIKDIAVDIVYQRAGNLSVKETAEQKKMIQERLGRIKDGKEFMILSDGTTLSTIGDTVWSNTQDYTPVFGMSPIEYSVVDSGQVYDEETERGNF